MKPRPSAAICLNADDQLIEWRQSRSRWRSRALVLLFPWLAIAAVCAGEPPGRIAIKAIAIGGTSRASFGIAMMEMRTALSDHVFVSVAPTIATFEGAKTERQLRAAVTLVAPVGPLLLDDRNLWVFSDSGTTRYRNRLRLTAPVETGRGILRLQLLNEVFYERGGRGWFRNMLGAGIGVDVDKTLSVDAYWQLQDDAHLPATSIVYIVLTAHLR